MLYNVFDGHTMGTNGRTDSCVKACQGKPVFIHNALQVSITARMYVLYSTVFCPVRKSEKNILLICEKLNK